MYLVPGGGCSRGGVPAPGGCTWSWGWVCSGGVSAPGGCTWPRGCLLQGGVCSGGVSAPGWGVSGQVPPPVNRMTNRCKNITLPQTSFAGGNYMLNATAMLIPYGIYHMATL